MDGRPKIINIIVTQKGGREFIFLYCAAHI